MTRLARSLLLVLLVGALVSCATSRGTLLSETQAVDTEDTTDSESPPVKPEPEDPEDDVKGLRITTDPDGAVVLAGAEVLGVTPLDLEDLEPGSYKFSLEKEGYRTVVAWIDFDGKPMVYAVALEEITGFLRVSSVPADATILVDGAEIGLDGERLRIGSYEVVVRAFGYREHREWVRVYEDTLTTVSVVLEKAPFEISALTATRRAFSPLSFGSLGQTTVRFSVTAPGSADLAIHDADGRLVLDLPFPTLSTWDHEAVWNGRDEAGEVLPDGVYRLTLRGQGADGLVPEPEVLDLTVDSSAVIEYRSLLSGTAGLAYVGTPDTLPPGSAQISALAMAHVATTGDETVYRVPVALGFRLGLEGSEIDLQAGTYLLSSAGSDSLPLYASLSGRYLLARGRGPVGFGVAVGGRLAYHALSADTLTDFTGLGLQAPARLTLGPVSLLVEPELVISYRRVGFADEAPAFWIWGYGRAGILVSAGPLVAGVSTAVRLRPFSQGIGIQTPLPVAAEAHLILPGTQIVLSVVVSAEIESTASYYVMGGGGFAILN